MKKRIHPATGVLVIAIVLVLVMMSYRQRMETAAPEPTVTVLSVPQGPPMEEKALGISWTFGTNVREVVVARILPSPPPSRLALIGVKPSDVLVKVDEEEIDLRKLELALDVLQDQGKPFTLTVMRGGQYVKLEAKQLPESLKGIDLDNWPAPKEGS